jgi:hypothetical protein
VDLRLIPFVLGAALLETGLIVFFEYLTSISNGSPPGGTALAMALASAFFFGLLFLLYGTVGRNSSTPAPPH